MRRHPATFPLATEAGAPCNVLRWLRHRGDAIREWHGGCRWAGQRDAVRLIAATLPPTATGDARRRARRQAHQAGRTITAPPLAAAGWLLRLTTLDAAPWSAAEGLSVYRARGHVELGFKTMQPRRRLNQSRRKNRTSVEATVRARLVAWALHADPTTELRRLLSATASSAPLVVSRWFVSGLGLETWRQQVQGPWSEARVPAGVPRLRRFGCRRPRRRGHQAAARQTWWAQRACPGGTSQPQAAYRTDASLQAPPHKRHRLSPDT